MDSRLYIVGRADLAPGLRSAQAGHAVAAFALEHPLAMKRWGNSYLIFLEVNDLRSLLRLSVHCRIAGLTTSSWHEPDLDDQLTAIAIAPSASSKALCSGLPLMHSSSSHSSVARAAVSKTEDEGPIPSASTTPTAEEA